jgi:hypothetical protein
MLQTAKSTRGMVVAPHQLASQAGLRALQEGGNAIEAMIAAAATVLLPVSDWNRQLKRAAASAVAMLSDRIFAGRATVNPP